MKMAMEKNAEEELFWFRKYYERDAAYLALIDSFIQVYKYTLQERVGWGIENEKIKRYAIPCRIDIGDKSHKIWMLSL